MPSFPYRFFEEFVVRTPLFSYKTFIESLSKNNISDSELKEIYSDASFQEAVYLASPYLYKELEKWVISKKEFSLKNQYRLKNTLLKYYSRISSRCTPFGLFSGICLGKFDNNFSPIVNISHEKIRDTKLDMHFLVSLSQYLSTEPKIKERLLFYPNTSIYKSGNKIRYVEYTYNNGERDYINSSVSLSIELEKILDFSADGKTIEQLGEILINDDITVNEAKEFIEDLIDSQILISELEPHVSGGDFLLTLISSLRNKGAEKEYETLISIQKKLKKLDKNIFNSISSYYEIENLIKTLPIKYESKFLFQTDLYYQNKMEIPLHWKKELKKGISFLNKISLYNSETFFYKFKKAFSERFDDNEVSLLYALDTEIGIGYRQDLIAKGIHSYLDDLKLSSYNKSQEFQISINSVHYLLNRKLQNAQLENTTVIKLTEEDLKDYSENWDNLPDTISFMAEIISENNKEKLIIQGGKRSSAANLLARFSSEKSEIQSLTKKIAKKELDLNSEYILAEIIHLPEARIGNIIRRPTLRSYEIPYLAQSILPKENQVKVDDLYISLKNDRIVLRSKKLNKEIKPYLTNAHNYSSNSLPIYHFLSDLYSQNIRSGLQFDWGDLKHLYIFFPRIEYENIIFSKSLFKF